jgi:hypothetical protein
MTVRTFEVMYDNFNEEGLRRSGNYTQKYATKYYYN